MKLKVKSEEKEVIITLEEEGWDHVLVKANGINLLRIDSYGYIHVWRHLRNESDKLKNLGFSMKDSKVEVV